MSRTSTGGAEPIRRTVSVSWAPEAAYQRFVADFSQWWPRYALSIGGRRVRSVIFEPRVGGRIYEEHEDGTRFLWGTVIALEPPRRVAFTFHSSRAESDAQLVEVTFASEGTGTRVELVSTGWEKMSPEARRAHGGYKMSWKAALDAFAARSSGVLFFFAAMSGGIDLTRGRDRFVRNSLSRMPTGREENVR
jgi:uncharacterized protein YndB with AHSA1/START domain